MPPREHLIDARATAPPPAARAFVVRDLWIASLVLFGLCALAARRDYGLAGGLVPVLGVLIVLAGAVPLLVYQVQSHRSRVWSLPFLPVLGLVYGLYYGLPALLADRHEVYGQPVATDALAEAQRLALAGWIALLFGYYALARIVPAGRPIRIEWDPERARPLALKLIGVGLLVWFVRRAVDLPGSLGQIVVLLERMLQAGVGILVLLSFRGDLPRAGRRALWLLAVPFFLFLQVGIGSVAQLALMGVFLLFLCWGSGRRVPWLLLASFGFVVLVLRGSAEEFRQRTWWNEDAADMSSIDRSVAFAELVSERFVDEGWETVGQAGDLARTRTGHVVTFAHVVARTPEAIPYWGGETYRTVASSLVPRVLWPDKPEKRVGQEFGHRYGILAADDHTTAINLPQLVELFANFGPRGVLLGMAGLGVLYRLVQRKVGRAGSGDGTILVGAMLFSTLLNIESDFSLVFGALLQTAVVLVLVVRWARPRASRQEPRRAFEATPLSAREGAR